MNRLFVFDPCLFDFTSHNFSEAMGLVHEAVQLGLAWRILCHEKAERKVTQLPAQPFFRAHPYSFLQNAQASADFVAITYCNRKTFKDLCQLSATVTANDFVLFPTVTCNIVMAICQWIRSFALEKAPRFGMCLMFPPDVNTAARPSPIALDTYREAFALLRGQMAGRIVWTCETEGLSQVYEPLVGTRPLTLPIPTWSSAVPRTHFGGNELRISFLGSGRMEKGFRLLPGIVPAVHKFRPEARFRIQTVPVMSEPIDTIVDQLTLHRDFVTLINRQLSGAEHLSAMSGSSLLLLPYNPDIYKARGSGLFTEARRIGVPMVLPAATAIGAEGRNKGIAETFGHFTVESITAATLRAIDNLDELSRAASREAASIRDANQGYLAVLLRSVGLPF